METPPLVARLDRYILMQLLTLFGFFSLVLVAVYWVNRAVKLFDTLIGDGQSTWVFLQLSVLTVPSVVSIVLPSSAFVASVFVANKLTADSELVVMQATGFSSFRLARPVIYFAAITTAMMLILTNILVPISTTAVKLRNAEIARNVTAKFLKEGQFMSPSKDVTLYIREITPQGELLDVFLSDARLLQSSTIYTAERAFLLQDQTEPKLLMFNGMVQRYSAQTQSLAVTRFSDLTYAVTGLTPAEGTNRRRAGEMDTLELLIAGPMAQNEAAQSRDYLRFTGHYRISWPLATAASALIGFSTLLIGAFSRFGLWRQILAAVALLIVLYAVDTVALSRGRSMYNGWILAYAAPVLGFAMTWAVLWASQRPRRQKERST